MERFRTAVAEHKVYLEQYVLDETPLRSMWVHHTLAQRLRRDDVLVFDGGDYAYYGRAYLPALAPRSWYYLPNLGMLGQAVPMSIAAKVARPDSRVFCITGDGAFGFNAMEVDTAVRHGLKVVFLVGNDAAWGIDKNLQVGLYGKAVITGPRAVALRPRRAGAGRLRRTGRAPRGARPRARPRAGGRRSRAAEHPRAEPDQPARAGRRGQPPVRRRAVSRLVVYGAGAIGGQIAVRLANAGLDPLVVEPWDAQREAIQVGGLTMQTEGGGEEHAAPSTIAPHELTEQVGLLFLCVKSYDTMEALAVVKPWLADDGLLVSMQNSINEEWIAPEVGAARTVGGVILVNGSFLEPGRVQASGSVSRASASAALPGVYVGEYGAPAGANARRVADALANVWPAEAVDDLLHERWSKMVNNTMLNPVSAVGGMRSAELLANADARRIAVRLAAETMRVAEAEGPSARAHHGRLRRSGRLRQRGGESRTRSSGGWRRAPRTSGRAR